MIATFSAVGRSIKIKWNKVRIDNLAFKIHYRYTFLILAAAILLVSSRELIGEHINCLVDKGIPQNVINRFCFFTTTFTVVKHQNSTLMERKYIAHPGVGPMTDEDEVTHHAYYQWVPFVLTFQAIMFYIPHYLWKKAEGGRLQALCEGLQMAALADPEHDLVINGVLIPSHQALKGRISEIQRNFISRLHVTRSWSTWLIGCEFLNLVNVIIQIFITDAFLGGKFFSLGPKVMHTNWADEVDVLDIVFPKMTKCNFYKYGPSGGIQKFDSMCVMALNIIHEKIYVFLWFWFLIVLIVSILSLIWRFGTYIMHSRSARFTEIVFAYASPQKLSLKNVITVTRHCEFADWLFLLYLASNMDGFVFKNLFVSLAEELSPISTMMEEKKDPLYFQPSVPKENEPMLDDVDSKSTDDPHSTATLKIQDAKVKDA